MEIKTLSKYYAQNKEQALKDFFTFLKFESISSEPDFKSQVLACSDWVANYLKSNGFDVEIWPTSGHPTIFAQHLKAGPEHPTLLIYNHYDVQPVDPLELWETPPFEPTIKDGQVFARGAQDNKGQCFYVLFALKALQQLQGLPINIKLCIEGEEECGSTGLAELLQTKKKELQADYLAIVDVGISDATSPSITLGVRGIVTMDVEVTGSNTDLHSGSHGGLAYNPLHALVNLLGSIRDDSGRITIPGFYDDVLDMPDKDRRQVSFAFDHKKYEKEFGAKPTGGEQDLEPMERNWLRPTLEINGIKGGYSGDGFKTVIPAKAIAKVSCRLVPNQDPIKIGRLVAKYFESKAPEGVRVSVHIHPGSGKSLRASPDSRVAKAFSKSYEEIFGKHCERIYCGASIPIVTELAAASNSEVILVGLGLDSDAIHAPNEHFSLDRLEKGFLSIARAIQILGTK